MIADHFFQAAFGGSFLNHQWLIAARAPLDTSGGAGGANELGARRATGCPTPTRCTRRPAPVVDGQLTRRLRRRRGRRLRARPAATSPSTPCSRPARRPAPARQIPLIDDAEYPNIGDRMTRRRHLAGTGTPAAGTTPPPGTPGRCSSTTTSRSTTSPHYAPGQPGRAHLQDETQFIAAAQDGHAADGQLRQAVRRRERAPRLRQRARRQRPPRRPAQGGHRPGRRPRTRWSS